MERTAKMLPLTNKTKMEHHSYSGSSILGAICTILLFILSQITISQVAAGFTILAACSTIFLNIYKYKQSKNKQDGNNRFSDELS